MRDLQAALTGSSETMKKYGVVVNAAAVEQELLNQSLDPSNATEAEKAIARINIILRDTKAAQGDATRSAGSFANQLKAVRGQLADMAAAIGSAVLPILADVVGRIRGVVAKVAEWVKANPQLVKAILAATAAVTGVGVAMLVIGPIISGLGTLLGVLAAAVGTVVSVVTLGVGALGTMVGAFTALLSPMGLVAAVVAGLVATFNDIPDAIGSAMSEVADNAATSAGRIGDAFGQAKDNVTTAISAAVEALKGGDLEGAASIAALGLKNAFLDVFDALKLEFDRFVAYIGESITSTLEGFQKNSLGEDLRFFGIDTGAKGQIEAFQKADAARRGDIAADAKLNAARSRQRREELQERITEERIERRARERFESNLAQRRAREKAAIETFVGPIQPEPEPDVVRAAAVLDEQQTALAREVEQRRANAATGVFSDDGISALAAVAAGGDGAQVEEIDLFRQMVRELAEVRRNTDRRVGVLRLPGRG